MKIEHFCRSKTPRPSPCQDLIEVMHDNSISVQPSHKYSPKASSVSFKEDFVDEEKGFIKEKEPVIPIELKKLITVLGSEKRIRKCSRSQGVGGSTYATKLFDYL